MLVFAIMFNKRQEYNMIWAIIGILFVLWLLGLILKVTAGGLIHLLLVVAVIIALVRLFSGRRAV